MEPDDLSLIRLPGTPAITGDGGVLVAVAVADPDDDRTASRIVRLTVDDAAARGPARYGDPAIAFTRGPADSDPVLAPDGRRVAFRRTARPGADGPDGQPQLYLMPVDGGEPWALTTHPLGAGVPTFSPDGRWLVHPAAVPEPGRYRTDPAVGPESEPARRVDRFAYRADDLGFVLDRYPQLFAVDLQAADRGPADDRGDGQPTAVRRLTDEPLGVRDPVVTPGSDAVLYVRPTGLDELTDEIAAIALPGPGRPGVGRTVVRALGSASRPVPYAEGILYYGIGFRGTDLAARTTGLWWAPAAAKGLATGGTNCDAPRRLTDEETVDLDPAAGRPAAVPGAVLVAALHRGTVSVRRVPFDPGVQGAAAGGPRGLNELTELAGSGRLVRSFAVRDGLLAAVVADPLSTGEVLVRRLPPVAGPDALSTRTPTGGSETVLSDFGADLRDRAAGGVRPVQEITATSTDGRPVHGFLVLPPGPGPHPVLLVVHGGPHAAYSPAFFDEAQVYAGAGYAVVLANPRGSAGYGQAHARAVLHRLGTVDAEDLLALLDAVCGRPDCDADRVGVMGGSYGGFMTTWLLGHTRGRFVAGLSERAVNAWDSFAGSSDIGWWFTDVYVGPDRDRQWAASPLAAADSIDRPLLIMHSEQDWRCPVEQAQRLFVALRRRGVPVEMVLFPGEGHELSRSGRPRHRRQRFEIVLDWWRRHLPVTGSCRNMPELS